MRLRSGTWGWSAAALLAGAILRGWFVRHHAGFAGDPMIYGDLAHNVLSHHIYGFTELDAHKHIVIRPTLIRLPGYPLFLAMCFAIFGQFNFLAVVWVQVALDLVGCALLAMLAGRLWGERTGLRVLWLASLCPFTANYAAMPLTETLSLLCVVTAFFSLERWLRRGYGSRWAALIGSALVGAVLLRPEQAMLGVAVVPVMAWVVWREGWRRVASLGVCVAMIAVPMSVWTGRNWRTLHQFSPLAPKYANDAGEFVSHGFYRWYRTWGITFQNTFYVYWDWDGSPLSMSDLPDRAFDSPVQKEKTAAIFARYNQTSAASVEVDTALGKIGSERIAAHPVRYYLLLPVARELDMWLRPRTELMSVPMDWWNVKAHRANSLWQIAYALLNLAFLTLAIVGLWRWRSKQWNGLAALPMAMIGFIALRSLVLLTLDNSEPRYTLECFPVVILLAGLAITRRRDLVPDNGGLLVGVHREG